MTCGAVDLHLKLLRLLEFRVCVCVKPSGAEGEFRACEWSDGKETEGEET